LIFARWRRCRSVAVIAIISRVVVPGKCARVSDLCQARCGIVGAARPP
jgi:hypothetical protein